jgi:hypothetical protein
MGVLAAFVLVASLEVPIAHPCDAVLPSPPVATKGSVVGWCHDMRDDSGLTFASLAFRLLLSNTQVVDLGAKTPLGAQNAEGLYYFEAPLPSGYGRGVYDVKIIVVTPGEPDSVSTDYALWQVGGPANKPQKPRIGGGQ